MTQSRPHIIKVSHPITQILQRRMTMRNSLRDDYLGRRLKGNCYSRFISDLQALLPSGIRQDVLVDSTRKLVGLKLTFAALDETCWRLSGNVKRLKQGHKVSSWVSQPYHEFVPVQIVNVTLKRGGRRGEELGHEIKFQVLAGTPCTQTIIQWWSLKRSRYAARFRDKAGYGFGFSRSWPDRPGKYPYYDATQLMTLRCMVLIDPKLCDHEGPGFKEIASTSAITSWNRTQLKFRVRAEAKFVCIKKFPKLIKCHECPVGLDQCRAATHNVTYELKTCEGCSRSQWFDPADQFNEVCVDCVKRKIVHTKTQ